MADLNKTIQIIFGATDKTGSVISGVSNRLGSIAAPVADLTKKFLILEAAIAAVGVAFAVKAFKESVGFEGSLLDLQKVMSDADGDARQWIDTVDDLSVAYGQSATDILQSAADFKQSGFTMKEAFELQKISIEFAIAGGLKAEEASERIKNALKGFEAPASEAGRLTDIMNEVSNNYGTNMRELASGMADLSPIAKLANLTFEETAAVLTPIIEVFGSGSEAAVALKTGLLRLVDPAKKGAIALERIGVTIRDDLTGTMKTGKDILFEVAKAFETLEESEKLAFTSMLVGKNQAGRMTKVFDNLGKVTAIVGTGMDSTGSRIKEVAIRLKSAEVQIDRAKVAFNNMAREIGDQFRPEITGIIKSITDIEIAIKGIVAGGGFEPLLKLIRPQLKEWQDTLGKIAQALPAAFEKMDFSPILDALKRVGGSFDSMFDGLDLTKPEDLAKVFNRIIDIGGSMIDVTAGIVEIFGEVGAILFKAVKWFSDLDSETQKIIGSVGGISIAFTTLLIPALAATGTAMTALNLKFVATAGARGVGALTTSLTGAGGLVAALGKAGLVGALAAATFELGKFIKQRLGAEGLIKSLTGASGLTMAVLEARNKAAKEVLALPGENTSAEKAALDAIRARNAKATKEVLDSTGKQTDAVMEKYNKLVETIGKRNAKSAKEVLDITGKQTDAIDKQTDVQKKLNEAIKEKNDLSLKGDAAALSASGAFNISAPSVSTTRKGGGSFYTPAAAVDTDLTRTENILRESFEGFKRSLGPLASVGSQPFQVADSEARNRKKSQDKDLKLKDQQIALNKQRLKRGAEGDAIIKITADGLEPELEAFIWPLLERIQLRANADGEEYLLGIT
ncbi:MAG: phage tail tape measure protein [Planctomycetes bacterium]|nr:phage tail tape measure protein [Planctomycetota bacterium]